MTCYTEVRCPQCDSNDILRAGKSASGEQRYRCRDAQCSTNTFMLNYRYIAWQPGIKEQAVDMALNGSGIRDTARVLKINKNSLYASYRAIKASGRKAKHPEDREKEFELANLD